MFRKSFFFMICLGPLLLSGQDWKLRHQYPTIPQQRLRHFYGPESVPMAVAPDSVLYYYQPESDPGVQEILQQGSSFSTALHLSTLRPGDNLWVKVECTNVEDHEQRYLLEADLQYGTWSTIDVFEVDGNTVLQTIHLGNQLPAADKPIRNARNLFWLDFKAGEYKTLLFRLVSDIRHQRSGLTLSILDPAKIRDFEGYTFLGYDNPIPFRFDKIPHAQALHSLEYYFDITSNLSFSEIHQNWDQYGHFLRESDLFKYKATSIWCRLTLINPDSTSHFLLMDAAGDTKIIDIYLPQNDGKYRTVRTGNKASKEEKTINHTFNLFDFRIAPRDTVHLFLHYHPIPNDWDFSVTSLVLGVFMFEPFALLGETKDAGLLKGVIMGMLFFQFFYFLLRSVLEKNKLGMYYALMILGFTFLFIVLENRVNTFIAWRMLLYHRYLIGALSLVFFSLGIFCFTDQYLRYRVVFPWIYKLQKFILWVIIVIQVVHFIQMTLLSSSMNDGNSVFFNFELVYLGAGVFFVSILLYIILAVMAFFKKIPYASQFLIAFSPFFITLIFAIGSLAIVGLSQQDLSFNLMYGGFSLTSVLFAIVGARRHNEMKIKEAYADSLIELDKAKSEFYSSITHEFRTPLTVIMGLADTIRGHEREKELIQKNGQEVLDLVQQLLDISKAQAGILQLKLVDDNIVPYLEYLVESFHSLAEQKRLDLTFNCEQQEIVMTYDREKVKFMLSNLVANAIKFTSAGGRVSVLIDREDQQLVLKVKDTGIGLSPEDQERIFDRFYRARKNGVVTRQGDGIGLALVKDLVALLQGTIQVHSKLNRGTTFIVTLPIQAKSQTGKAYQSEDQDHLATDAALTPALPMADNEFVVLLVEDNVDVVYYIERILSPNYKVVKAYDGKSGWETSIDLVPDLIICDVMMPVMDGYQLTAKLKEDPRTNHIPIILLTALAAQEDRVKGLQGGADAYLTKPFHEEELHVRIKKLIEGRRKLQDIFAKKGFLKATSKAADPFLVELFEILEKNYADEDFGIQELAAALHMSRMQVHRKIKALTNYSTSQFLNAFRLEKGKALLGRIDLSISEVAYSCGFSDPGYFGKLFRKRYGQSPHAFRERTI